ncbi:hypothetical protein SELMODRAFT_147542 [Selaginella moellendorffii]|uniref:Carbonic anhydrase n=1 Tax=Selaginella moellendorffii TaxID=88036 RepID=D8RJ33_SELML|nr:alpha carbonic anhydrase 7 [Selaginella moellendorffii]EFJ27638.1 hypothetical protein SELMODRAFT_147542 [Selaginella moellendorffii]|eukprot:XP_002971040.1 alpha carbonic anhydrase 7 [Selaginella moellendorffii]
MLPVKIVSFLCLVFLADATSGLKHQSPIALSFRGSVGTPGVVDTTYRSSSAIFENGGDKDHRELTVGFLGDAGQFNLLRKIYHIENVHFHMPSEHTIDGIRYPMEIHVVHKNSEGNIAVIGLLYDIGPRANPFITQLEHYLSGLASSPEESNAVFIRTINPELLQIPSDMFFRYNGSLTTPPYSENVVWNVYSQPSSLTTNQYSAVKAALKGENARALQPLNNRLVQLVQLVRSDFHERSSF